MLNRTKAPMQAFMPVWALFVVPGTFSPWAAAPRPFVLEGMTIPTERKERTYEA